MPQIERDSDSSPLSVRETQGEREGDSESSPRQSLSVAELSFVDDAPESTHDALLALLATHTGQIVWVRDAAGLVTWEAGWSAYTGQTPGSAIGLRWLSTIHPDDVPHTVQVWAKALQTHEPYEVEQRILRADGEYRMFRSRAIPVWQEDGSTREWVGVSVDITEYAELASQGEAALTRERTAWDQRQEAYRRLLAAFESTSDCVLAVDREWRITYVNAAAEQATGVFRGDYVGGDLWERIPQLVGGKFEEAYRRAAAEQTPVTVEAYYPLRQAWFESRIFPSPDGLVVYYRDVTAIKREEQELQGQKNDLLTFVERAPMSLLRADATGHIVRANPALCTLLGRSAEELVGCALADFELRDEAESLSASSASGAVERRYRRSDGSVIEALVTVVELTNAEGAVTGQIATIEDVTELRRLQRIVSADASKRWPAREEPQPSDGAARERAHGESAARPGAQVVVAYSENPEYCPTCGKALIDEFFVNPAGELVGCRSCADQRELAGATLSREQWLGSPQTLAELLHQFRLPEGSYTRKPRLSARERPQAHTWEALTPDGAVFHLRRYSSWYPDAALRFQQSLLAQVAETGTPIPRAMTSRDGLSVVEAEGARWSLYSVPEGQPVADHEWQWLRPKAAELLGQLHVALEHATPEGEPFALWAPWGQETLDAVLESWPQHPDLPPELLDYVRQRLATRYFGGLYPLLPKQVIHGAFTQANTLWLGAGLSAQGSGILGFEQAQVDTVLADLAADVSSVHPPMLRAVLAAYTAVRPLSPEEREALPDALLLEGVKRLDRDFNYLHDVGQIAVRAQALQALARNLEGLRNVATASRR